MAQSPLALSPAIPSHGLAGCVPMAGHALAYALVVCLAGCSPMPSRNPHSGELEYRYRPPSSVKEGDRKECVVRAEDVAQRARVSISATEENTANTAGVLFGALGAMANVGYAVGRIRAEREAGYEKTMRACLTEKGYSLP